MVGSSSGGRGKDTIDSMENALADMLAQRGAALSKTNEGIDEHISMGDWARVEEEWWSEIRGWTTRREHEHSECGTGTLPSGDQQIS